MKMKKVIIPALVVAALATTNVIASACFSPKTEPVKPDKHNVVLGRHDVKHLHKFCDVTSDIAHNDIVCLFDF